MSPRRLRHSAIVVGLLLAQLGCLESVGPSDIQVGLVRATAVDNNGVPSLRINAGFETVSSYSFTLGVVETCVDIPFTPPSDQSLGGSLDAGGALVATVSGNTQLIARQTLGGAVDYPAPAVPLAHAPGDSLRIEVPGSADGFPASEVTVRTAEALVADSIVVPATPEGPIPVRWTRAAVPGSFVSASLRYTPTGSLAGQRELYCLFADDGEGSIESFEVNGYLGSEESSRSIVMTRVRFVETPAPGGGVIVAFSFYSTPLPVVEQ